MTIEIIKLPAAEPTASYLIVVIDGKVYTETFSNQGEIRRHFQVLFPRRLMGYPLPTDILESRHEKTFGEERQHSVYAVLSAGGEPLYHVVLGPTGHIWDFTFSELPEAIAFATAKLLEYRRAST